MDTTLAQAPTIASRETSVAPRIYFLHPLLAGPLEGWGAHFDRITKLGFNHVLIAPPFAASSGGSLNVTADPDVLDPRIAPGMRAHDGIARIAQACRSHGLSLLLDVVLDRIGEDSALARTRPDLFAAPGAGELLDPRRIAQAGIASARGDLPDFTAWWSARLTSLAAAGQDKFRGTPRAEAAARKSALVPTARPGSGRGRGPRTGSGRSGSRWHSSRRSLCGSRCRRACRMTASAAQVRTNLS